MISDKELTLTRDVVEIMEWTEKYIDDISVPILYNDFIPIIINKKYVTLQEVPIKDSDKVITFRPLLSGKAVQYLVDYLFDTEDSFKYLLITKDDEKKRYTGSIITYDNNDIELHDYMRETQLKFALFYKFYYDRDIKYDVIEINKFNNEQKMVEENKRQKNNRK